MRRAAVFCFLLTACTGGGEEEGTNFVEPVNEAVPANQVVTTPTPDNGLNHVAPALEPPNDPGLAAMSPYRRREYQRGWRDCMTGNYDRERQGESYRIGCMAAEEEKEAGGR